MQNALASVKGTAYGLGDATTVAAGLVAAGVEAGDGLERALKLVADTSAISGRSMDEMGQIFNKIAASGKMSGQEMNQLMKSGIPILQLLSDTMGMSVEEVQKLVSAGKIGMPEFQDAIEKGMGGAALAVGQTFQGSVDNFKAAFSRKVMRHKTSFPNPYKSNKLRASQSRSKQSTYQSAPFGALFQSAGPKGSRFLQLHSSRSLAFVLSRQADVQSLQFLYT